MSTEDNKALARRAYDVLNQGNLAAFYEVFTPDFVLHNASMTIQGLEAYKQWLSMYLAAFPDAHFTLEDLIVEGDTVVVRQTFRGTHKGDLPGLPATNKSCAIRGSTIFELQGDKIRRNSDYWDMVTFLKQVGVMPSA
jgi:steroid delta-isomerase-like uncharacterized protein